MGKTLFPQPPVNEPDLKNWRRDIHNLIAGEENKGGNLNGDNFVDMDDPGDTTDVSDTATVLNALLAELRTSKLIK